MSRFLKTLSKMGLVELDPEEHRKVHGGPETTPEATGDVDEMLAETEALLRGIDAGAPPRGASPAPPRGASPRSAPPPTAAPPEPAEPLAPAGPVSAVIQEGRPFSEIYAAAEIPPSPFPAEKLGRLLDGLKAMDPPMRKAAVMAMDAADDHWSITDPIQDAQRKVMALQRAKDQLRDSVSLAEQDANAELAEAEAYQKEATERIRAEIIALESLLQQELAAVAERKATAQGKLHATREAASREAARLDQEMNALNGMLAAFAP